MVLVSYKPFNTLRTINTNDVTYSSHSLVIIYLTI